MVRGKIGAGELAEERAREPRRRGGARAAGELAAGAGAAAGKDEGAAGGEEAEAARAAEAAAGGEEGRAEGGEPQAPLIELAPGELRGALEAVLFSASEPVTIRALSELFAVSVHDVRAAVEELREFYIDSGRAFRIEDIAGGVQLLTVSRHDPWVASFHRKQKEGRLSPAALETLAVIAYKQPLQRADLEAIRGVGCGPVLQTLLGRGLIQIVGRAEALGRPVLYGTTRRFLETFGLHSTRDLPQPELEAKLAEVQAARESEAVEPGDAAGSETPMGAGDAGGEGDGSPPERSAAPEEDRHAALEPASGEGLQKEKEGLEATLDEGAARN
jgi:segregation and condensation protein B